MNATDSRPLVERDPIDRIMAMATALLDVPIAAIAIDVDGTRILRSMVRDVVTERTGDCGPTDISYDADGTAVIEDLSAHPGTADNPFVTGPTGCRFYAGAEIVAEAGERLGTLCALDTIVRDRPTDGQMRLLRMLASQAAAAVHQMKLAQVQAERAELLRLAESLLGLGHWRLDFATGKVSWSEQVYRIHGLDPATFDPSLHDALSAYHPEDRMEIQRLVEHARTTGEGYDRQLRLVRADGDMRLTRSTGRCVIGADGMPEVLFGVFQDVTEDELAARRLQASEQRYRLLANNATDIIATYGLDGVFTYVSPAIETAMGYLPDELVGRSVNDIIHPDDIAPTWAAFQAYLSNPGGAPSPRITYRAISKSGEVRWLEAHPSVTLDDDGRPVEIQDLVRDVSASKALEAGLTAAKVEAERAMQAKSDFLANMSHEIRTPLTAILGFSSLLSDRVDLPHEATAHLDRISTASDALLSIVNDVLDFSKIEAGRYEIEARPHAPVEVCHEALLMFSPMAQKKGVALEFAEDGVIPAFVAMDAARTRQILLNLIGNAVKFTDEGSVRVTVAYDAEAERLTVAISDTGPGMDADQSDRLFQRFSQVDGSSTRRHGGTGLGLAICKGLSEAMGGGVDVVSAPGRGSTFRVHIHAPVADEQATLAIPGLPQVDAADLAGLRLLVVDDNAANREICSAVLSRLGIEVSEAASGGEAVDAAQLTPFDVILMDMRMPGMNGPQAMRAIRDGGGPNAGIPILAFSADVIESRDNALVGFDGAVRKPLEPLALIQTLIAVIHPVADAPSVDQRGAA